jgi:ATP-dependent RNA helicase DDX24/MAK5
MDQDASNVQEEEAFDGVCTTSVRLTNHNSLDALVPIAAEKLLPQWAMYNLSKKLLSSLHRQGFSLPTPIQVKALPVAMSGKDVIGVAETVRSSAPKSLLDR